MQHTGWMSQCSKMYHDKVQASTTKHTSSLSATAVTAITATLHISRKAWLSE
jgi:hypothetical protein